MRRADVVVIGGGVVGLSAAWRLARAGREVVLLERFRIGHDRGSSHGPTRIFRFSYDDPVYVRLAQQALPLWRELEHESGADLLSITGGIDVGDGSYLDACAAALRSCGARADEVPATELRERFPWIETDGRGVFSPDTGVLRSDTVIGALALAARAAGATVEEETTTLEIHVAEDEAVIRTSDEEIHAPRAILAAGAWMRELAATAGMDLPLSVTREQVLYFDGIADALPFIHWSARPVYGIPGEGTTMKIAEHGTGRPTTTDDRSFDRDEDGAARVEAFVRAHLGDLDPTPIAFETCLYTNTPDQGFIIDARGPVVIGSTCSGHGFKFGPMIGETLAAVATGREPAISLGPFSLGRFA
jgi:sarcosine oxidase